MSAHEHDTQPNGCCDCHRDADVEQPCKTIAFYCGSYRVSDLLEAHGEKHRDQTVTMTSTHSRTSAGDSRQAGGAIQHRT
jgi:hypothetical protein